MIPRMQIEERLPIMKRCHQQQQTHSHKPLFYAVCGNPSLKVIVYISDGVKPKQVVEIDGHQSQGGKRSLKALSNGEWE